MSPHERVILIGTGTGIGKTHLGVTLLRALAASGAGAAGLKPVESGIGAGASDSARLAEAASFHVKQPPPYAFEAAISPHLAAERVGVTIHLDPIVRWVDHVDAPWAVIETAGALLSPLSSTLTNLDLVTALAPTKVVLVAPDRLGVLHDVSAALFAYRVLAPRLPEPVVALVPPVEADTSTGLNAGELLGLEIARAVVTFLRAPADAPEMLRRAAEMLQLVGPPTRVTL